jgi:hypothetical protein
MSLGNATFGGFMVGRASRLPSNDLPTLASALESETPAHHSEVQKQAAFGIIPKFRAV